MSFWLGYALEMSGDHENAHYFYRKACDNQPNMPRPRSLAARTGASVPAQVTRIAEQMRIGHADSLLVRPPKSLVQDLMALNGNGSSAQVEEAIRCLGQYLGLESTRPDKEYGTGPDVLWLSAQRHALCFESKTDKHSTSSYRKKEVGQLHDHIQWVTDTYDASQIVPAFVGPSLPVSKEANPSPEMKVIELQRLHELSQRLISALQDVANRALPLSLERELHEAMKSRNLLYPNVISSLGGSFLEDVAGPN